LFANIIYKEIVRTAPDASSSIQEVIIRYHSMFPIDFN